MGYIQPESTVKQISREEGNPENLFEFTLKEPFNKPAKRQICCQVQ